MNSAGLLVPYFDGYTCHPPSTVCVLSPLPPTYQCCDNEKTPGLGSGFQTLRRESPPALSTVCSPHAQRCVLAPYAESDEPIISQRATTRVLQRTLHMSRPCSVAL